MPDTTTPIVRSNSPTSADSWLRFASSTARRVNLAWWLQAISLPITLIALSAAALILGLRYYDRLPALFTVIGIILGIFAVVGFMCYLWAKRRFEHPDESLVRIEEKMKLRNSLTAARAGVTAWPAPHPQLNAGLKWHLPRTLLPTCCSLALIVAAFFIPIGSYAQELAAKPTPAALTDLENQLEALKNEAIVQDDYIEDIEQQVEEIKQQDPEDWFSHSSLEAIDNLKNNHESAANDLKQNLKNAERALQNLQKHGDKIDQATKQSLLNDFTKAVENMDSGAMKPNKELLDQLKKIDPKQLDQLTPEQLDQLRQNMRKMAKKLQQQNGDDDGEDDDDGDDGEEGEGQQGKGGIDRGPGHADKLFGKEADKLGMGKHERIKPKDLSNTLPGDLLETTDGEHKVDKTDAKIRAGGDTKNKGDGGERVWKNSLLPDEKKALKKFFK